MGEVCTEDRAVLRIEGLILSWRGTKGFAERVATSQGFEGYLGVFQGIRKSLV